MRLIHLPLILILLISCSEHTFRSIDEFELTKNTLHAGEYVKIIYSSGAPDDELNPDYYVHMIGVSQESNDTVNILTQSNYMVGNGQLFYYFEPENSSVGKIMQNLENIINGVNINDLSNKKIDKVVSNKKTASQEINNYPTIAGLLVVDRYKENPEDPTKLDDLNEYINP